MVCNNATDSPVVGNIINDDMAESEVPWYELHDGVSYSLFNGCYELIIVKMFSTTIKLKIKNKNNIEHAGG